MNFKDQAEQFLKTAQTRKRNPIKTSTVRKYESSLTHVLPLFGTRDLADVNNNALKTLVSKLAADGLSASTIVGVVAVVKLVVASAVNDQGEELYPRTWNHEFIDLPVIDQKSQKAPVAGAQAISQAIRHADGQDKALYALLAGSGLRGGEALALYVGPDDGVKSTWNPETGIVYVRSTLTRDGESSPKTTAGIRQVDLSPELNAYLIAALAPVEGHPMFHPIREMTAYDRLKKVGIPGFHSFRRFRLTHLRKSVVRESLIKIWMGHANESVTDRYDKISDDISARKEFAVKAGLGFELPRTA